MIFYVEGDIKFHLYHDECNIIFLMYTNGIQDPQISQKRWRERVFGTKTDHLDEIIEKMKSEDDSKRELGKKMLEQTLNVKINGAIVGHYEGTPV